MKLFLESIYGSMNVFFGAVTTFGVGFGVVAYFLKEDFQVAIIWVFIAGGVPVVLGACLLNAMVWIIRNVHIKLPGALQFLEINNKKILLVEPSKILGQGIAVSIYFLKDGFERLIGEGYVYTIQQDGNIQILVVSDEDGNETQWKSIASNSGDALEATVIRPGNQIRESVQ